MAAHLPIAISLLNSECGSEFKIYLIKEFQRLKEKESVGWNVKRDFAKINYGIHIDAIQRYLIPEKVTKENRIYADEADLLNVAIFGMTAKEWKEENKEKKGNIRDYANISQLVCLANLESLNSLLIKEKTPQDERLIKLNEVAISQMRILSIAKQLARSKK